MKHLWKLALVSTLALLAACGNNSGSNQIPPSTFRINPSLTPSVSSIPDPEGVRLARWVPCVAKAATKASLCSTSL